MSVRETILDALVTAFENAVKSDDTGYAAGIKQVSRFDENLLTKNTWESPLVMFIDIGEEKLLVGDSTHHRFVAALYIRGFVKTDTEASALSALNDVIADVKRFINSAPSIGSEVLSLAYVGSQESRFNPDQKAADSIIAAKLTYVCGRGTY